MRCQWESSEEPTCRLNIPGVLRRAFCPSTLACGQYVHCSSDRSAEDLLLPRVLVGSVLKGEDAFVLPRACFARALPEFHLLCAHGAAGEDRLALESALGDLDAVSGGCSLVLTIRLPLP